MNAEILTHVWLKHRRHMERRPACWRVGGWPYIARRPRTILDPDRKPATCLACVVTVIRW